MPRLPAIAHRQFVKKLRKAGFVFARQARGSHEIWFNPETKRFVSVPYHAGRTFKKGTLHGMIKDTGMSVEKFNRL